MDKVSGLVDKMKSFVDIFTWLVDKTSGLVDKMDTFVDISNLMDKVSSLVDKIAALIINDDIVLHYKNSEKGSPLFAVLHCFIRTCR